MSPGGFWRTRLASPSGIQSWYSPIPPRTVPPARIRRIPGKADPRAPVVVETSVVDSRHRFNHGRRNLRVEVVPRTEKNITDVRSRGIGMRVAVLLEPDAERERQVRRTRHWSWANAPLVLSRWRYAPFPTSPVTGLEFTPFSSYGRSCTRSRRLRKLEVRAFVWTGELRVVVAGPVLESEAERVRASDPALRHRASRVVRHARSRGNQLASRPTGLIDRRAVET